MNSLYPQRVGDAPGLVAQLILGKIPFRVARRAEPLPVCVVTNSDGTTHHARGAYYAGRGRSLRRVTIRVSFTDATPCRVDGWRVVLDGDSETVQVRAREDECT